MTKTLVCAKSLFSVLLALEGAPHLISELRATRSLDGLKLNDEPIGPNPINVLIKDWNAEANLRSILPSGDWDILQDILDERFKQIARHGYTPQHDDGHVGDEVAALACFYAMPEGARDWDARSTCFGQTLGEAIMPEDWPMPNLGTRYEQLIKAAALCVAEAGRLKRETIKS